MIYVSSLTHKNKKIKIKLNLLLLLQSTCFPFITEDQFYKIMKQCLKETSQYQTVEHMFDELEHFLFHIKYPNIAPHQLW